MQRRTPRDSPDSSGQRSIPFMRRFLVDPRTIGFPGHPFRRRGHHTSVLTQPGTGLNSSTARDGLSGPPEPSARATVRLLSQQQGRKIPPLLDSAAGLLEAKMDLVVQKATELGVHPTAPGTRYSEGRGNPAIGRALARIMIEACKQCRASPCGCAAQRFCRAAARPAPIRSGKARPPNPCGRACPRPVCLLLREGPHRQEAGAPGKGFQPVSLGRRIRG
jgi:hypothetical protein